MARCVLSLTVNGLPSEELQKSRHADVINALPHKYHRLFSKSIELLLTYVKILTISNRRVFAVLEWAERTNLETTTRREKSTGEIWNSSPQLLYKFTWVSVGSCNCCYARNAAIAGNMCALGRLVIGRGTGCRRVTWFESIELSRSRKAGCAGAGWTDCAVANPGQGWWWSNLGLRLSHAGIQNKLRPTNTQRLHSYNILALIFKFIA